ncbi:AMP-binding protein [Streptomyces sp. NBC_00554]|uniref:AMP-binding protein n=1 Tax=Streptomyces sp. NBC_00554 TaxID=2903661 RepID=UPI00352DD750|nr:AMP-binding protein [Streptomyces sp. NBC_00554]
MTRVIDVDHLWELVSRRAEATPDKVFAVDEYGGSLTFDGLRGEAERVAAGLAARGVTEGTVVSWQLPTRLSAFVLMVALSRLGAVQNPLVSILRRREVEFVCRQARPSLLIVPRVFRGFDHEAMARDIAAGQPGLDVLVADDGLPTDDPALLPPFSGAAPGGAAGPARWYFYTSGTTADPKGVKHRDATIMAATRTMDSALRLDSADVVSFLIPAAHIAGPVHLMSALRTGHELVIAETFEPAREIERQRARGVTHVGSGVPFIRAYLAYQRAHPEQAPLFPDAKSFLSGGAAKSAALHEEVRRELGGIGILAGYGLTECPMLAWGSLADDDEHLAHSEGRGGEGMEVVIVTADERRAEPGEEGEVRVRGPQLMDGYVDPALETGAFDADGLLRTGDLGRVDKQGHLTITGRLKDVIIRNMENISAQEIENALATDRRVADVAVLGMPDVRTGERVCAVVVPADPGLPPTLAELCERLLASGLSRRKLPEQLEIVAEVPRNALGKVIRAELRKSLVSQSD